MKPKYTKFLILSNLVLLLFFFNMDVFHKEQTLESGQLILLELIPVDPRSLMQGDYMTLRYRISSDINRSEIPNRGYIILTLDENSVGQKIRVQKDVTPLNNGEQLLKYYFGKRRPSIGAESYFFQEGKGEKYEKAKYGGIMVDENGKGILVDLYNKEFQKIE